MTLLSSGGISRPIDTHVKLVKQQGQKALRPIAALVSKEYAISVEVLDGLHEGTVINLQKSKFTLGSESAHDVMLLDDELLDCELFFELEASVLGPVMKAKAGYGQASIDGVALPSDAWSDPQRLPCSVSCNGISVRFTPAETEKAPRSASLNKLEGATLPLLLVNVVLALVALSFMLAAPSQNYELKMRTYDDQLAAQETDKTSDAVRYALESAGMSEMLSVTRMEDGAQLITGSLPNVLMPNWSKARSEIDRLDPGGVVMTRVDEAQSLPELPSVMATILGSNPKILFADGTKLGLGDTFKEGWIVTEVQDTEIHFSRDGEKIVLEY